jgi:hypothetical protein
MRQYQEMEFGRKNPGKLALLNLNLWTHSAVAQAPGVSLGKVSRLNKIVQVFPCTAQVFEAKNAAQFFNAV